jgi:hypothetical protein
MAGPLIYFGTHVIEKGKVDIAREASQELAQFVEANHPRFIHFEIYIDEGRREMTVIQIHPDEESMALHMQLAGERIAKAYEFLEGTTNIEIFGAPSEEFLQRIKQMSAGAPLTFHTADAGFSRLASVTA